MFENSLTLCRFIFRRDRIRTLVWFIGIMLLVVGYGSMLPGMYPAEADRLVMIETMKNPAMIAMMGPVYESGGSIGALYANLMFVWTAMFVAVMNVFLVIRHTRSDEEQGRTEVVRSLPVGRLANLSSVMIVAFVLNLVFAICMGLGLAFLGDESMGFVGSLLFGVTIGAVGLVFAAITAIFCQVCANPRTAMALSLASIIVAFMLRALGDMQEIELLACLSPLGLMLRTKVFIDNLWWPVVVAVVVGAIATGFAFWFCAVRDLGEGLVPAGKGKRDAAPYLKNAFGLAWRLLRTPVIIWAIVMPVLGVAYGSIMGDLESFIESNELFQAMFPDGDPMQFVSLLMVVMAMAGTIPIIQFMLKARSQESGGYAENVLACSVSHYSQLSGYFIIALLACFLMPSLTAFGFWAGSVAVMEDPITLSTFLSAAMVYIPSVLFMLGVALLLVAYLPRLTYLVWAYLGGAFFAIYFGSMMQLPNWTGKLFPFGYIPRYPVDDFSAMTVVAMVMLCVIAAGMYVLGFVGYRKRDMSLS